MYSFALSPFFLISAFIFSIEFCFVSKVLIKALVLCVMVKMLSLGILETILLYLLKSSSGML